MKKIRWAYYINEWLKFGGGELFITEMVNHLTDKSIEFTGIYTNPNDIPYDIDALVFSGPVPESPELRKPSIRIMLAQSEYNPDWYLETGINLCTHALAVSHSVKSVIPFDPCHVIHPGIDLCRYELNEYGLRDILGFKKKDFVVGYFGRNIKLKRIDHIIDAVSMIDGAKLLLVGNGPETPVLFAKAEKCLKNNFRYISFIDPYKISLCYNTIDAFCLASDGEGCPRVMWESLIHGVSLVSRPLGGILDFIENGKTGWIVDDVVGMADALVKIQNHPFDVNLLRSLAKNYGSIWKTSCKFEEYLKNIVNSYLVL